MARIVTSLDDPFCRDFACHHRAGDHDDEGCARSNCTCSLTREQLLVSLLGSQGEKVPTITVNPEPAASLGATITFTITDVPKQIKYPRVIVHAYDPSDNSLIYAEAGSIHQATGDGQDSLGYSGFLLGGGAIWKDQGGPANCAATLFYFDNKGKVQEYVPLAITSFAAAG